MAASLFRTAVLATAALALPLLPAPRAATAGDGGPLPFRHLHTGERLTVAARPPGGYPPAALAAVDRLLRDHRDGTVHPIDPALVDLLFSLREKTGGKGTYE